MYSFAANFPEMYNRWVAQRCTALLQVSQRCTTDESLRDVQLCCKFPRDVQQMSRSEMYSFVASFPEMYNRWVTWRCTALLQVSRRCTIDESLRDVQLCCKFSRDVQQTSRSEMYSFAASFPEMYDREKSQGCTASFPEQNWRRESLRTTAELRCKFLRVGLMEGSFPTTAAIHCKLVTVDLMEALNRNNCRMSLKSFPEWRDGRAQRTPAQLCS